MYCNIKLSQQEISVKKKQMRRGKDLFILMAEVKQFPKPRVFKISQLVESFPT